MKEETVQGHDPTFPEAHPEEDPNLRTEQRLNSELMVKTG